MKTKKKRVGVISSPDYPVRVDVVADTLGNGYEITVEDMPFRKLSGNEENEYGDRLSSYDALLARSGYFGKRLLEQLSAIRIIALHAAGFDHVDIKTADRLGIYITNTPGANAVAVAELALALILDVSRRISYSNAIVRKEKKWDSARHLGSGLRNKKLGLMGFGKIASAVAARAHAFEMAILAYDPFISGNVMEAQGVIPCNSHEELLKLSDIVSLHMPETKDTYHFMNASRIREMKHGSILINTARGGLVDEAALYEALVSGQLGGAGLDVLEKEPLIMDNPLIDLESVVVTPHMGGSSRDAIVDAAKMASEQIKMTFNGELPTNLVNRPVSHLQDKGVAS